MSVDDGLREVIPFLKRYRGAANIVFGEPAVLKRLCKLFGFKNECARGRIFLTGAKIQRLEEFGLPPATEPPPPDFMGAPTSLEASHAEARADRDAVLDPPKGHYVGAAKMPPAARAYAFYLQMDARLLPLDTGCWSFNADHNVVMVSVPNVGMMWGRRQRGLDETLAAIEARWGANIRARAEEAVNG